ncbi:MULTISPECIES: hypothetical protein [unclassified Blastococcus]
MTTPTGTTGAPPPARRRLLIVAVAVLLVAGLVGLAVTLGGNDGPATGTTGAAADPTSVATGTAVPPPPPTPEPTGPTEDVDELPAPLPEVALEATADAGTGVTASLPSIRGIEGTATGPGNIAGPAVQVTVRVTNGTGEPLSVSGVAVNMYYSDDRTPASPLEDPSQRPLSGMLAAGESAEGVYVFSVPADSRDLVTVEVGYEAGAPLLLFTGPVR